MTDPLSAVPTPDPIDAASLPSEPTGRMYIRLSRVPTGAKLFLILSGALLPLALIAVFATLQMTRITDEDVRSRLRVTANESAHALAIELAGDMTALHVTVQALGTDPADAPSCARAEGVFAQQANSGTRFAILDPHGALICGDPIAPVAHPGRVDRGIAAAILPDSGLVLSIPGSRGGNTARAFFPAPFLSAIAAPATRATAYGSVLSDGDDDELVLQSIPGERPLERLETLRIDLGVAGLALRTTTRSAPITSSFVVALLLPLLMWAAAAGIGWFVVDHLLIRPLRRLRAAVAEFTPGEIIDPVAITSLPAQEIRELGDTFRAISRTVALHEAGLAEGLVRQTKLTREVHHRVKNNLQVISSLINFHARGARSADATAAYASIQRRVDALAVVHRNHFAELEENRGLNLRPVIGELAANIRATAADTSTGMRITLDVDPYLVNQDVAVALAFLITESIELATSCDPSAQIRVAVKPSDIDPAKAVLRVVSRALVDGDLLQELVKSRYGRVMEGLSRQLRAPLHHDPLVGAYEIPFAVQGRD